MNSIQCADGIAAYLRKAVSEDSMKLRFLLHDEKREEQEEINVYTGFLPYAATDAEKRKL